MYDMEELMRELEEEVCKIMYNKTFYYNKYSGEVYDGVHFENHKVALFHHLVDIRMLLLNRGIKLDHDDDQSNLPYIEAVLVDSIPVKFAVEDTDEMVKNHAKVYGVELPLAQKIYKELMDILSKKIGLETLVFTGWFDSKNKSGYYIVVSEMI